MKLRKLIAVLAAVFMVVSMMPLSVFAEMGGDFPWTDAEDKMLIEEILERDGLIDGVWFPWMDGGRCGHNLTGNDLYAKYYNDPQDTAKFIDWNCVEMDRLGADTIYRQIYNLKAMGYNVMAYAGSIYAEGVVFDENGDVIGIKEEYLNNARRLLDMCRDIGMPVMWNVYFHSSTTATYYGIDGWKVICQMLGNNEIAVHYAERFVRPLCEMLAEYPDVVALVSIADEPENEINDDGIGDHFSGERAMYGVNQEDMVYFMQQINEVVREELPNVARTVASNSGNKAIYRDFDLDLMGHNQYTDGDSFKSVESLMTDADPILTEYNIGGNTFFEDDVYAEKLITFREWMMANGYKGGFQWCWLPDGAEDPTKKGSAYYLLRNGKDSTSFRKTVTLLRHYMDEYRADFRGESIVVDAPVLYANAGDGKVLWIPSEKATAITIQRSDDGGETWITLEADVAQSDYVDEYLIGEYWDDTAPESGYCYRIIAKDIYGNSVTSQPNNVAGAEQQYVRDYVEPEYRLGDHYLKPTKTQSQAKLTSFGVDKNRPATAQFNLIDNGSFESVDGQWNNANFLQYASVVSDATTPLGEHSLYFNTASLSKAGWYTFTVSGLKANTDYTFSAFLKGAYLSAENKGYASIGVMDPDTNDFMVYWEYYKGSQRASRDTQQLYPPAWDDAWHLRSVQFNSGDMTEVTIALYGYSSQLWVDGLALLESANGVQYNNGQSSKAVVSTAWEDLSATATNAVEDPSVNNAAYWTAGAGYKQGFMSVASGKLAYTASADPCGVRYVKWVSVKPNTDYYYTFTVNVTRAGSGRFALLDSAKTLPNEVVVAPFSATGTKTYKGRISTGQYDRIGLCVVDLGGAAAIDDVTLYEAGESVTAPTDPSFDGYIINGDFEIGSSNGWENLYDKNTVEIVPGYDSVYAMKGTAGGQYTQVRQKITLEPHTDYIIEVWAKDVVSTTLIVKSMADRNLKQTGLMGGSNWTKTTLEFNSGENTWIHLGFMGNNAGDTWTVDDVTMYPKMTESNDGYIVNGDFETGITDPWENVWGSNTVSVVDGHNSAYGMKVNANMYNVVRQKVAVEKYTDYIIEAWVKDCNNGVLLVKDSADADNILNCSLPTGSTWTKVTTQFNSGNNDMVYVGFMGNTNGATYTVDDVTMYPKEVLPPAEGLQNGDFEEGERYWMFNSGAHDIVTDAYSGDYALQLTDPHQWGEAAIQTFPVDPDSYYTITWWYKAAYGTGTFNLAVVDGDTFENMYRESGAAFMNNYSGAWTQGSYTVNTGSSTSMMLKWSTEDNAPGTILIDDIVVEQVVCAHRYSPSCSPVCSLCGAQREVPEYFHNMYDYTQTSATCVSSGVRYHYCQNYCGYSYTETIPATGQHTYRKETTQSLTCADDGIYTYYCYYCEDSYTETIPATGNHSYDSDCDSYCNVCWGYRTAPHDYGGICDATCNACGYTRSIYVAHTYSYDCDTYCNVCGEYREAYHHYVEMWRSEPGCGWDGSIEYECDICHNDGYGVTLPATGNHRMDGVKITREPTCNQAGQQQVSCSVCHNYSYYESIPATGEHAYTRECDTQCMYCGQWTRTDATHTWGADGCIHCNERLFNGDFELGTLDYWTSNSGSPTIVTDAHSGSSALQITDCPQWGEAVMQIIDVQPYTTYVITWWYKADRNTGTHNLIPMNADGWANLTVIGQNWMNAFSGDWQQGCYEINTQEATQLALKLTSETGGEIGNLLIDDVSVKSQQDLCNHDWEWIGETAPSCTEDGAEHYYCWLCASERDEVIPSPGHNYQLIEVCPPSCTEEGYYIYECDNDWEYYCGHIYTEVIPATGHAAGAEADCVHAQLCVTCGTELAPAWGHTYTNGCDPDCNVCGFDRSRSEITITFDDTTKRIEFTTQKQVWIENGILVTNNKSQSTSNLGDYYQPVRFYKGSEVIVEYTGMVKIVFDCYSASYASYLKQSIGDAATLSGDKVTVTFAEPTNLFRVAKLTSQVRVDAITVYTAGMAGHNYEKTVVAPDCMNDGSTTYTCTICGDSYSEEIPAAHGNIIAVDATEPTCTENGNLAYWYCADCGAAWLDAECTRNTNLKAVVLPAAHSNIIAVDAVAPTCTENGNLAYWYCAECGAAWLDAECTLNTNLKAVVLPANDNHSYEDKYDALCDACGEIRMTDYDMVISFGGNSVSEDVSGLAFKFSVEANVAIAYERITQIDYAQSVIGGLKLVKMGAVAANNGAGTILDNVLEGPSNVIDIPAVYACNRTEDSVSFSVRITEIPEKFYDTVITVRPYFIYESAEGVAITIYGEERAASYNAVYANVNAMY